MGELMPTAKCKAVGRTHNALYLYPAGRTSNQHQDVVDSQHRQSQLHICRNMFNSRKTTERAARSSCALALQGKSFSPKRS